MEEKTKLASKGPNKKIILIMVAILALVVLIVLISSNQDQSKKAPLNQDQANMLTPGDESAALEGSANVATNEGEAGNVVDGNAPAGIPEELERNRALEAPIEKTEPITVKVDVGADGFSPSVIDVKAGQEVTLSITASNGTSIIVFSGGFASATGIGGGQTKDIKFTAPAIRGEYSFRNDVPTKGFTGTINVK